jgi:hypothetical protein
MGDLDYAVEPKVECLDNDPNNVAFVRATITIGAMMLLKSIQCVRFFHWLPVSALRAFLWG